VLCLRSPLLSLSSPLPQNLLSLLSLGHPSQLPLPPLPSPLAQPLVRPATPWDLLSRAPSPALLLLAALPIPLPLAPVRRKAPKQQAIARTLVLPTLVAPIVQWRPSMAVS